MTRLFERMARTVGVGALTMALLWPWIAQWMASSATAGSAPIIVRADRLVTDTGDTVAQHQARAIAAHVMAVAAGREATSEASNAWPTIHAQLNVVPSAAARAVLGAGRAAGLPIQWRDSMGVTDIAVNASASAAPRSTTLLDVSVRSSAPSTSPVSIVLRDAGGTLDSAAIASLKLRAAKLRAPVAANIVRNGHTVASTTLPTPNPTRVRDVLLFARAGWESKFVAAALEESGWVVEGTISLSPTSRVRLGAPQSADTSRYAAVVVLDSGLTNARSLMRFVEQGGGVILAGEALRDAALSSLSPARVADDRAAIAGALLTEQPRRGLPAFHLVARGAAVVMESEGREPVVVAARRGVGRVMSIGYRGTWHWRMEGREEGADEHRTWWNDMVSAVAHESDTVSLGHAVQAGWPGDAAPVADLVARFGPSAPDSVTIAKTRTGTPVPAWLLYLVGAIALLVEWALRRVRGAP